MASIRLTYSCGHQQDTTAHGRQRAYLQGKAAAEDCWNCRCAAENAENSALAQMAGLPPLTGKSAHQIAYGETCRSDTVERVQRAFELAAGHGVPVLHDYPNSSFWQMAVSSWEADCEEMRQMLEGVPPTFESGVKEYLAQVTDAGWWCGTKGAAIDDLVCRIAREAMLI